LSVNTGNTLRSGPDICSLICGVSALELDIFWLITKYN
jgi:hypothetical protein